MLACEGSLNAVELIRSLSEMEPSGVSVEVTKSCTNKDHCQSSDMHKTAPTSRHPPSHTSPPRRSAPTAAARSRQTRIRFQDCIASGMPSCSSAQHGTSVGGQLQPQKCTPSPNRHVYEISSVPWLSNADCECKSVSWNKVSLSSQAGHPGSRMPGSDCIIDFGFRVITLKSHRRARLRRQTAAARSIQTDTHMVLASHRLGHAIMPRGSMLHVRRGWQLQPHTCAHAGSKTAKNWLLLFLFAAVCLHSWPGARQER